MHIISGIFLAPLLEEFRGSLLEKVSGFAFSALQQLTLQCDIQSSPPIRSQAQIPYAGPQGEVNHGEASTFSLSVFGDLKYI